MFDENNVMSHENVLPEDFSGIFYFTNYSDQEFLGKWGGKIYKFPAGKTSPMVMPEHSPIEIQYIRKKFAKDLAEQEFFKSDGYKTLSVQEGTPGNRTFSGIHQAAAYSMDQLTPWIQKALEPLEKGRAEVATEVVMPIEDKLSKNDDGDLNSAAMGPGEDKKLEALAKGTLGKKAGL